MLLAPVGLADTSYCPKHVPDLITVSVEHNLIGVCLDLEIPLAAARLSLCSSAAPLLCWNRSKRFEGALTVRW